MPVEPPLETVRRRMMAELRRPQLLASGNVLVPRDTGKQKGSFRDVILPGCASLGHIWWVLCSQRRLPEAGAGPRLDW